MSLVPILAGVAHAQINSVGPFSGAHFEGFEAQVQSSQDNCVIDRVFGDARICARPGPAAP